MFVQNIDAVHSSYHVNPLAIYTLVLADESYMIHTIEKQLLMAQSVSHCYMLQIVEHIGPVQGARKHHVFQLELEYDVEGDFFGENDWQYNEQKPHL